MRSWRLLISAWFRGLWKSLGSSLLSISLSFATVALVVVSPISIGRRLMHQQPDGELTEDPVWRWSSAPDRYLDTALHFEVAASRDMRLVDGGSAPALGATLLVWDLESGGTRLVGAAEFQITGKDRVVDTKVVRSSEPVSPELPGDLAAAAGRLQRNLASEGLGAVQADDSEARDRR
jgi:hypothetical protein